MLTVAVESNEPKDGKDVFSKGRVQLVHGFASEIKHSQGLIGLRSVVQAVSKQSTRVQWASSALPNMLRDVIGGATLTRFAGVGDLESLIRSE